MEMWLQVSLLLPWNELAEYVQLFPIARKNNHRKHFEPLCDKASGNPDKLKWIVMSDEWNKFKVRLRKNGISREIVC